MVVRSVVRRSRLKELGVGRPTFSVPGSELPVPVGATVQIPSDKKIKVEVTIENTGSASVTKDFCVMVFYADTLSDSSGDPSTDYDTWFFEGEDYESAAVYGLTLDPGDTYTFSAANVPANTWTEGTKIDAGIVLMNVTMSEFYDSLKITDAVEIVAPALRVEITDVTFSEA